MLSLSTQHYLIPPPDYLWRWEAEEQAAVLRNETLLAFSKELLPLMKVLAEESGLPPLGAMLLVLSAAKNPEWLPGTLGVLKLYARTLGREQNVPGTIARCLQPVEENLGMIASLPLGLRNNQGLRLEILRALFSNIPNLLSKERSAGIVEEFQLLHPSDLAKGTHDLSGFTRLLRDLNALAKGLRQWSPESLENRLLTGLGHGDEIDEPADWDMETSSEDILSILQRSRDNELLALSHSAQQLLAALQIPRPVQTLAEQAMGGVSDIANKGDPSRLLLSELAWDDVTFSTRLAYNEALYLQRDSPPSLPDKTRLVLLDNGIFFWGATRIYVTAVALALDKARSNRQRPDLRGHLDREYRPLALEQVAQIKQWWSQLEAGVTSAPALAAVFEEMSQLDPLQAPELVWITHPEMLLEMEVAPAWQASASFPRFFIVTVDAEGALSLHQRTRTGRKLLSQSKLEPPKVLHPRPLLL